MKVDPVKQFIQRNVSRFEKDVNVHPACVFNLYDNNNRYCGEYFYKRLSSSEYMGVKKSISVVRIMDNNLNQTMQKIIYMDKDYVTLKDPTKDVLSKVIPSEITTIVTILDFVNDRFKTILRVGKLKNQLQRISENDPDFKYSDRFIIYEPLTEKLQYDKSVEIIREGAISETPKNNLLIDHRLANIRSKLNCSHQIPYRFW